MRKKFAINAKCAITFGTDFRSEIGKVVVGYDTYASNNVPTLIAREGDVT